MTCLNRLLLGLSLACTTVLGVSSLATAQPDVTHQNIQDTGRYPATGAPINGMYAYAWGSQTCNIGNVNLSWINGGTPGLAMNAYRLHDGRLMQIGLSNVKTACCVANTTGCGTCSTVGAGLRAGCRDTYSAGFNSGQSRLGPRSGINAWTGQFTSIPSGTGDAIWRRLQVLVSDMDATTFAGARYFAEGVYVCTEEPPAQKLNNATYRPMLVANTGATPTYNWTGTDVSQMGTPAIYAWRDHGLGMNTPDPSVKIVTVDVPGEGRFVVAGKVKDLGNRQWRYDYAVFNLSSDRSGAGFTLPIPPSAVVTGLGVHAAPYHSGEIYSNTPWVAVKSAGQVLFGAPHKFEDNPNTNAIRWGTMHNFSFTANVGPAPGLGQATLGLFKPGAPGSVGAIAVGGLPVPPVEFPCPADFSQSDGLNVADVFLFLRAWFIADPLANFNGVNGVTVADVIDFLVAWFAGC